MFEPRIVPQGTNRTLSPQSPWKSLAGKRGARGQRALALG